MTRDLRPFGQALAGWMRKKGLSTKRLAELAGYKSKTSIVRILREECVQSGRERLFARISELGLLSAAERRTLLQALELSRVGGEQAAARLRLRQLLMGRRDETPADTSLQRALDSLRTAHAARILLLKRLPPGCHRRPAGCAGAPRGAHHGTLCHRRRVRAAGHERPLRHFKHRLRAFLCLLAARGARR